MSEIISKTQKQEISSAVVSLYEIELSDSDTIYFYNGLDNNLQKVEFDGNTYEPIPIISDGFEIESGGAYARPSLTIGNVTSVLSDSLLSGQGFEDLIGKRITRRLTLEEYLGPTGTIEYPQNIFIVDRIKEKSAISVTLELAVPFDLMGINLPFRVVLKDTCPWRYKGGVADPECSGCKWAADYHTSDSNYSYDNTNIYVNRNDEYIVYNISATDWALNPTTVINDYYFTTGEPAERVNSNGTRADTTMTKYWQALVAGATEDPSESSVEWLLVHRMVDYNSSTTIIKYIDSRFSDYVLYNGEAWQPRLITMEGDAHITEPFGGSKYWYRGDQCGKTLQSCKARFHAAPLAGGSSSTENSNKIWIPFGGYPGSRKF